jgi:glycogen synthase
MHILMLGRGVSPIGPESGGAEQVCYQLARQLADEGDSVVLVADVDERLLKGLPPGLTIADTGLTQGGKQTSGVGGFVRWLARHLFGNVRTARRALQVLGREDFDVVHSHGALATLLVAGRLRSMGSDLPLLYTEHDSTPWSCRYRHGVERLVRRCIYRQVNLRACRAASAVVTNFPALAGELATRSRIADVRIETVPNGVDGDSAPPTREEEYFLFVGSLVDRKAPDVLLRAIAATAARCMVVGDGPLREQLEQLAWHLGISERVVFAGAVHPSDVHRYYERAIALVLPSMSEGVPLVGLEALRSGIPVIASRLDGIATVVRDEHNGLLVPPGDVTALAVAICRLSVDVPLRHRLRETALEEAPDVPDWHDVISLLRMVYSRASGRLGEPTAATGDVRDATVAWLPHAFGHPWHTVDAQQWLRAA